MASSPKFRRVEIPRRLDQATLTEALARRLAGDAIEKPLTPKSVVPPAVIWTDGGDEVLVHLDSIKAVIQARTIVVAVDLQTDQTGRQTLVMPFAVGGARDPAGLLAVTEDLPRGDGLLVGRWGAVLQNAVWGALLGMVDDYAGRLNQIPFGFTAAAGQLTLRTAAKSEVSVLRADMQAARRTAS